MSLLQGGQLGRYQIRQQVGGGGNAYVFKAYDPELKREVALKVLPSYHGDSPTFGARFRQEAQAIASLSHPNILQVYDFGEDKGFTYFVTKHIVGGTLFDRMGRRHRMEEVLAFAAPLADALDYAHRQGVVHRDFKPSNVLLDSGETPILADFGIARILEASAHLTRTGAVLGTAEYMSPEQALGKPADHRSDIYSFGVVLYELHVGRPPFQAVTPTAILLAHVHEPILPFSESHWGGDSQLEAILLKALAKDPNDRYQGAGEMVSAISAASENPRHEIRRTDGALTRTTSAPSMGKSPPDQFQDTQQWAAPRLPSPPGSRVCILLVEDQLVVCEALCDLIESDEALKPVRAVGTGEEAVSLLKTTEFDVVVVDLSLPGMSGIETTRQIKGRYPRVRAMILTGYGEGSLHEAIAAGADGFLTKGVDAGKLRSAIHDVHQGRGAIDPGLVRTLFLSAAGDSLSASPLGDVGDRSDSVVEGNRHESRHSLPPPR